MGGPRSGLQLLAWSSLIFSTVFSNASGEVCKAHRAFGTDDASMPTVTIPQGTYLGARRKVEVDGRTSVINHFFGIPFAKPPQRFRPPERMEPGRGVFRALEFGDACIQADSKIDLGMDETTFPGGKGFKESEDCLNLNIWTPDSSGPKPVMVWFYGGGFMFGRNSNWHYDGSKLAAHDVVIVAPNYRVNVFGFPGVVKEIPKQNRNLGLLDQRLALEWVKENIKFFGGDPNEVTVFGQSAGAISIDHHLASYTKATVPFRGAIVQSGVAEEGYFRSIASGGNEKTFFSLAMGLECPLNHLFECVRTSTAEEIRAVVDRLDLSFFPVIDDHTVRTDPVAARNRPDAVRVPVMYGSTGQEGSLFVQSFFQDGDVSVPIFLTMFVPNQGAATQKVIEVYGAGRKKPYKNSFDALTAFITDAVFTCQVSKEARRSAARGVPTWRYFFNATFPNLQVYPGAKAFHTSELPLIFGIPIPRMPGPNREQEMVSRSMMKAWTTFAKYLPGGPGWGPLSRESSKTDTAAVWREDGRQTDVRTSVIDAPCGLVGNLYVILPAVFH